MMKEKQTQQNVEFDTVLSVKLANCFHLMVHGNNDGSPLT